MKKTISLFFLGMAMATTALAQNADTSNSNPIEGEVGGHEFVDLGLPSGTLWATCNIGSDTPYLAGQYFAWGETEPRENFYWTNYEFYEGTTDNGNPEYILKNIGNDISGSEYDPAHTLWGNGWRMPSSQEFEELLACCQTEFTTRYEATGLFVTGPNGNTLSLPITPYTGDDYHPALLYGSYWSGTLAADTDDCDAMALFFENSNPVTNRNPRFNGYNIRPVISRQYIPSSVVEIDSSAPTLSYRNGNVVITGPNIGRELIVSDMSGRNVCSLTSSGNSCQLPTLAKGVYIITLNHHGNTISTLKVAIN